MLCFSSRLDTHRLESTVTQFPILKHFLQTQWIQSNIFISIISPSNLLREAIFHLVQTEFQGKEVRWSPTDRRSSVQGWVLWDYGIGRDVLVSGIRDWRAQYPEHSLMVMELPDNPDVVLDCIAAGAHAYVLQGVTGEQMIETMRQVDRGVFQCSMEVTARLVERLAQPQGAQVSRPTTLTQREWDVLHCIVEGQADRVIAAALVISVRTVKHHVHNLLGKLNVQSRWQAAQLARDHGWFGDDRSA
jgi:DNA-binding NarL/FixJ family response regulator